MRILQRAYFAIHSTMTSSGAIAAFLGMEPDRSIVRGSVSVELDRPLHHGWCVDCDQPGMRVDEQVAEVVDRLRPISSKIRAFLDADSTASPVMEVVRYFDYEEGVEEDDVTIGRFQKLSGQHQLLGWHLSRDVLDFLAEVGAALDADEYG